MPGSLWNVKVVVPGVMVWDGRREETFEDGCERQVCGFRGDGGTEFRSGAMVDCTWVSSGVGEESRLMG